MENIIMTPESYSDFLRLTDEIAERALFLEIMEELSELD